MAQPNEQHETLWTVKEAARYLNMSEAWVYKQCDLGTLPFARLGGAIRGRIRFHPARIREFATSLDGAAHSNVIQLRRP